MTIKEPQNSLTGLPCYTADELVDYVFGIIKETTGKEIEAHLQQCKRCRLEVARLRKAINEAESPMSKEEEAEIELARDEVRERIFDLDSRSELVESEKKRVILLWGKYRLSEKIAASRPLDWKAKKVILERLGLWKKD